MASETHQRISDFGYRLMVATMTVEDFLFPHTEKRANNFGIQPGMTVVDYACGPGRYSLHYAHLVGLNGKVYAVDIHKIAIALVNQKKVKYGLTNLLPVLAHAYSSGLPAHLADIVTAIDVFFAIQDRPAFLAELRRITKPDGFLILDDGHQPRRKTRQQIAAAGSWKILEETPDHLRCIPV